LFLPLGARRTKQVDKSRNDAHFLLLLQWLREKSTSGTDC
jgi:hypothetical protein